MIYTKEQFVSHLKNRDIISMFEVFKQEKKLPNIPIVFILEQFGDFTYDLQQYYMRKFELSVLYDKDNQLIKIL